ncbi:MAG: hypothetical protein Q8K61_04985 [Gallionella sp.]|nr:hypothetical protein [Gallionellaceae bacterium]MDP1870965.1 hypothetical protein [Gallionella sp.]
MSIGIDGEHRVCEQMGPPPAIPISQDTKKFVTATRYSNASYDKKLQPAAKHPLLQVNQLGGVMSNVPSANPENENNHLAEEHGLIKTTADVHNNSAKQRSAGAERVAKHRQQKKDKGMVQFDLPFSAVEEIKAAGSFDAWLNQFQRITPEKITIINQKIRIANKVSKLPRWLRWILHL